jgi:hypothetical protein
MTGDCHVRICESLGVKFPGATRPASAKSRGGERRIKSPGHDLGQVSVQKTSASEPSKTRRYLVRCRQNRGRKPLPGQVRREPAVLCGRRPAYRGRELDTGFCAELWEPACRCEGKRRKGDNPRPKVPMRQAGADSSVVVMTRGMPVERREGVTRIEIRGQRETGGARGFDGRRQPSVGGTSRMTGDCHVRLCVQERQACSAGDKPAGAKVRRPVVRIAE